MKRALFTTTALAVVLGLWGEYRLHRLQATFDRIVIGTSEQELVGQVGLPWRKAGCGRIFGGDAIPGCAIEVLYASPFAPLSPEYWAFQFNSNNQLIGKDRYFSP